MPIHHYEASTTFQISATWGVSREDLLFSRLDDVIELEESNEALDKEMQEAYVRLMQAAAGEEGEPELDEEQDFEDDYRPQESQQDRRQAREKPAMSACKDLVPLGQLVDHQDELDQAQEQEMAKAEYMKLLRMCVSYTHPDRLFRVQLSKTAKIRLLIIFRKLTALRKEPDGMALLRQFVEIAKHRNLEIVDISMCQRALDINLRYQQAFRNSVMSSPFYALIKADMTEEERLSKFRTLMACGAIH